MLNNESLPHFSLRVQAVSESSTTRIFTMAHQLRAKGEDIVSLAVGEPDFDTPHEVIQATRAALSKCLDVELDT